MNTRLVGALLLTTMLASSISFAAEPQDSPEAEQLYLEAERSYLKNDQNAAMQALIKFFSSPVTPRAPRSQVRAHNLKGLMYFQSRNLHAATQEFEAAATLGGKYLEPTDSILHLARYNWGNALYQSSRQQEAYEVLRAVNPDALDADTRARYYHLFGNVLGARELYTDALIQYLLAANLTQDIGARDTFLQKAASASQKIFQKNPKEDIKKISSIDLPTDSPAGIAREIFLAKGYLYVGEPSEAESHLESALSHKDRAHPLMSRAEELLADLGKIAEVRPDKVGVLLPLTGKFARFGRLCLNAINMASGSFEEMPERKNASGLQFVVMDSGDTAESALDAFERLIKEEKVISVIGPLLSKQLPAISRRAKEFGVPLLSLSQKVEADQMGPYIFPIALSPEQQIELVVSHAMDVNGYKRFAILAPDDSFGSEYLNLFWDAVEARGGEIVGLERYPAKSTDFRDELKRLLGLDYLDARKTELEELKRREALYASTLKVRGRLRQRLLKAYDPKAIVDFDAVFIPDDPATVGQIAPAFAVLDVENIPMLGINTWNTSEIVHRAGKYLQRALFVDGFFPSSTKPKTMKFVQEYMKYFNTIPGTIEVQAYDAASILIDALENRPSTRTKLKTQLLDREKFDGISGSYHFTPDGVKRGAHLLTVKGNSIVEIPSGVDTKE